jgi:hypothetical protein
MTQMSDRPTPRVPLALIAGAALVALLIVAGLVAIFWREWLLFSTTYPYFADALRFIVFAAPVSLAVGYGVAGLTIWYRRWGWRESIFADKQAAMMRAKTQPAPNATSFTYSPRNEEIAPLVLPEPVSGPAMAIPTFATMLDQNLVSVGRKLVLGYDEGGVLEGDWTDLYSTAVAGMSGQGKYGRQAGQHQNYAIRSLPSSATA